MNNEESRIYKFVPASTLGASIILAVVLHSFVPITTAIPFPYNFFGFLIIGFRHVSRISVGPAIDIA
jgi:hypothetical protein